MDINILKNLGLDSMMSQNDLEILNKALGSEKNKKGISPTERNNLISKLSSANTISEIPQKDMKDMNEDEKKIYREELKKKLKNKQNEKKMLRTNNLAKKSNHDGMINKLNEIIKNIPTEQTNNNVNSQNNLTNNNGLQENPLNKIDQLNNIPNQNHKNSNEENKLDELSDYLN